MSPFKDDPPKIAIKGFSLSAKSTPAKPGARSASKPTPASSLGKRPRSTFASHHSDSESGSESEGRRGRHEAVTAFGAEGAIRENEKRKEGPLVIERLGNRDWRGEARSKIGGKGGGGRNLLPAEEQARREAVKRAREGGEEGRREGVDVVNGNDDEVVWGLTVRKKESIKEMVIEEATTDVNEPEDNVEETESTPKTADEEALEALLGTGKERRGPELVIPTTSTSSEPPLNEEDAYRRAVASAPDVSTLEDYERIPVEEFGAAMLRGMGWKGPSKDGKSGIREVKKRQNLLGLGAKELKDAEELGAWVQKSDVKRLKSGSDRRPERKPKASEYRREKEKRDERREERGGGSYRRERERERDRERNGGRDYRDRDRERDRERDRRR